MDAESDRPDKSDLSEEDSEVGVAFSLGTFSWPRKRKYLGQLVETRTIRINNKQKERDASRKILFGSSHEPNIAD